MTSLGEMRFPNPTSQPKLTPLGHKLLQISDHKLTHLDPPLFGRDHASSFRKGVVVRQAVRSAWRSVDESYESSLTDWRSLEAMGVGVISEEEEEGEKEDPEDAEERMYDELLRSLTEDDDPEEHEWAQSISTSASQYHGCDDASETFILPSPSTSLAHSTVTYADDPLPIEWDETHVDIEDAISDCSCSDFDLDSICSADERALDEFHDELIPSLHRSLSSSSTSSGGGDSECITPKGTCEDLAEAATAGASSFASTCKEDDEGGLGLFVDGGDPFV